MHIYLKQGGSFCLVEPENGEEEGWNRIILSANTQPIITVLSDDVVLVKYHDRDDGVLVIFPYSGKGKATVMKLHHLPETTNRLKLVHATFAKLLDFDDGRLTNNKRNKAITIVRELLPDVVRNSIGDKEDGITFYLHKDQLSVYLDKALKIKLNHYTLFSRNIKDSLL